MSKITIPKGYESPLDIKETEVAIKTSVSSFVRETGIRFK